MENGDAYALGGARAVGELAKFELNDFGNAMRLILSVGGTINDQGDVAIAGATLLYLGEAGWIGWNGRFWDLKLGARLAQRIAHQVAANLAAQVPTWCDNGHDKRAAWTFARSAGNAGSITAMLRVAEAYLQVDLDAFDRDPQAITVQNGTLRLERVAGDGMLTRFSPHDPRDRITRMAAVDYDPTATAPIWAEKVAFWQPDPLMAAYLQRLAGYALTGHTHEQIFVIFQGKGRDGKSTYMNALRELWGEYGEVADVRTFLEAGQRGGGDATPDLARLAGDCRMLSVAEPGRGAKLNEAMIKSFTGGAPIVARRLRQDLFAFTPRPKVFMEANSRPVIKGDDEGIWRRIRLVLWEHQLSKDQVDPTLPTKLRAEASGIFNWCLDGLADWLSSGLAEPERIEAAMDDYRKGSSPFGEWFVDRLDLDPFAVTSAALLYVDYKQWCELQEIEKPMTQRSFGDALADRQIIRSGRTRTGNVMRQGARLLPKAYLQQGVEQ